MRRRTDPLILTLCVVWVCVLGALGVSAIALQHLAIGTRTGISTSEGWSATVSGIGLIGFALLGVGPLLDGHRFRKHIIALLAVLWLVGSVNVLYWRL